MAEFLFEIFFNDKNYEKEVLKEFKIVEDYYLKNNYNFHFDYYFNKEFFNPPIKVNNNSNISIPLYNTFKCNFQTSYFQLDGPEYPIVENLFLNLIKLDGVDFIYANEGSLWDYFGFGYFFYCKSFDLFVDAVIYRTWGINLGSSPKLLNKLMEFFFSNNVFQEDGSIIYAPSSKNSNFWHLHNSYYNFYNENREELTKLCEEVPIQKPYGYYEDKK